MGDCFREGLPDSDRSGRLQKPIRFWFGPAEAIQLRVFEIAFSFSFLTYFFVARFRYWREWLTVEGYHFPKGGTPGYHIDPFPLLEPWAALALGVVTAVAGCLVMVGRWRRASLMVLFGVAVYIQNADALTAFALNIHYLFGFCILALAPAMPHGLIAFKETGKIESAWPLRTLQAIILIQLFTAGWSKVMHKDWIIYSDVLWTHAQGPYRNYISAWMLNHLPAQVWTFMQWSALLFELIGPILFLFQKTRWIALFFGAGFVFFIASTMNDLLYFMMQLSSFFLLFVPIVQLRCFVDFLSRGRVLQR